jgi:ribosome-binding factor A
MASQRITRVNELIRREISGALFRLMNERDFDMSAVTVTRVITNPNLRAATVFVSIRDHEDDRKAMMNLLRKHRREMQELIARHLTLKYTPRLRFQLDDSIEKGDHVLDVLAQIDHEEPGAEAEEEGASDPHDSREAELE